MLQNNIIKANFKYDTLNTHEVNKNVNFSVSTLFKQHNKTYTETYENVQNVLPSYDYSNNFNAFYNKDWIFILGILLLFWLTYIKNHFPQIIKKLVISIFNFQLARQLVEEKSNIIQKTSWFLLIIYIFTVSLLLYCFILYLNPALATIKFLYLMILGSALVFYILKFALYLSIGYFTDTLNQTKVVLSHFSIYYKNMALFFVPLSIILYFVHITFFKYLLFFILLLFLLFSLMRVYRGIFLTRQMKFSYLFIFLYLCIIEIIPLMYCYKSITNLIVK